MLYVYGIGLLVEGYHTARVLSFAPNHKKVEWKGLPKLA
jgi:hypothetical protein